MIPTLLKNSQITHLISPYHQTPLFLDRSIKSITIIHDICGILPSAGYQYYKKGPYRHWFNFLTSLIRADGLVYVSKHTKTKFEQLFPFVKKRPSKICYSKPTIAANKDYNEFMNLLEVLGIKYKEYYFAYGSPGIRKGTDIVLESFVEYKNEGGEKDLILLTSKSNVMYFEKLIEEIKFPINIITNLTNKERDAVYYGATALIFPSRCEGFGLPFLEAMHLGCPPIALKNSPANEIIGGCVPELEELNRDEIVKLMFFYDYQEEKFQKLMEKKLELRAAEFLEKIEIGKEYLELINSL